MAINNIRQMIDAELQGRVRNYQWRKVPTQGTSARRWFDMSSSPGNPPPKYWFDATPGVAKAISQSVDGGLYHGPSVSPSTKYARRFSIYTSTSTPLPMPFIVADYLLYYPSIDDSITDPQTLDNSVTLPRYTDGNGVMMMALTVASRTGGQSFFVTYTNQDGVAGRTSQTVRQDTSAAIGSVTTSVSNIINSGSPFIPLQNGDSGVRSIESVTMLGADVGLFSLLLVKPLFTTQMRSITAFYEKDLFMGGACLPVIQDDAFIGMVGNTNGTIANAVFIGDFKVIWD